MWEVPNERSFFDVHSTRMGVKWSGRKAFAILLDLGLGERIQIVDDFRGSRIVRTRQCGPLQCLLQRQGEEAAEYLAALASPSLWKIGRAESRCRFVPPSTAACTRAWLRAGSDRCWCGPASATVITRPPPCSNSRCGGCTYLARCLSGPPLECMSERTHFLKAEQPRNLGYMQLGVIKVPMCQIASQLLKHFSKVQCFVRKLSGQRPLAHSQTASHVIHHHSSMREQR
jgi:hypothetical protein